MLHIVSYDFPSSPAGDKRRARLAKLLTGLGLRVQYSVFELEIPSERIEEVCSQIRDRIDAHEDSVRIYPICSACIERTERLGREAVIEHGPLLLW